MECTKSLFKSKSSWLWCLRTCLVKEDILFSLSKKSLILIFKSSANDSVSNQQVAIKKLSQPFQSKIHCKRALREIKLLKHVKHDNIIRLFDIFTPANNSETMEEV